tara:strand:- start:4276 stop:8040 length:3765 start_codon:yes stop_codon:yes gene_type:complete
MDTSSDIFLPDNFDSEELDNASGTFLPDASDSGDIFLADDYLEEDSMETSVDQGIVMSDTTVEQNSDDVERYIPSTVEEIQERQAAEEVAPDVSLAAQDEPLEYLPPDPRVMALFDSGFEQMVKNSEESYRLALQAWENSQPDYLQLKEMYDMQVAQAVKEGRNPDMIQPPSVTGRGLGEERPTMETVKQNLEQVYKDKASLVNDLLNDPNPLRREMTEGMVDAGYDIPTITFVISGADWTPVLGAALGVIDIPDLVAEARYNMGEGNYKSAAAGLGISLLEGVTAVTGTAFALRPIIKSVRKVLPATRTMARITSADAFTRAARAARAEQATADNADLAEQLLNDYQNASGSADLAKVEMVDGKKVVTLDVEAAKEEGLRVAQEVMEAQQFRAEAFLKDRKSAEDVFGDLTDAKVFTEMTDEAEDLVNPLLKAEKFNAIVGVAARFKANKKYAGEFDQLNADGKKKTVIETLFDLTTDKKIGVDTEELADALSEYGLSFNDYVNMVVGSGSEAGKILQKLSMIRKAKSIDEIKQTQEKVRGRIQADWLRNWRRVENIRRGGMVSMVKTASRNFGSAAIRMPLETLENVFDTTFLDMTREFRTRADVGVVRATKNATIQGVKSLVSPSNWRGSTKMLQRTYLNPVLAKDLTDFILKRPEFQAKHNNLFDLVNEYQTSTGRGDGGVLDASLSKVEDLVSMLNTPNRIQEFIIRRGAFIGELERLVKREYNTDLIKLLEEGKLFDLMEGNKGIRPKGAPEFAQLIEDSTRRALDITYASPPEIPVFNEISNFLTRNGLTAFTTPFPRFMFKSLELMGQYSAGAFNPAIKRAFKVNGKKWGDEFDRKDRQNISRNLSGLAAITAAYNYRMSDDAPKDYKQINTSDDTVWDATSFFPMRQALWIAEAMKRLGNSGVANVVPVVGAMKLTGIAEEGTGTFNNWFDIKDAQEVFLGTAARTGTGNVFVEEISNILSEEGDVVSSESGKRVVARAFADYLRTWAIPITQVSELQRVTGYRPATYTDQAEDRDTLTESFPAKLAAETERGLRTQGITNIFTPSEETEGREPRIDLFRENRERKEMGLGIVAGTTMFESNSPEGEYLTEKGFSAYEMGSKSRVPSIRRAEDSFMLRFIPTIVESSKNWEASLRREYLESTESGMGSIRDSKTIDQYVNTTLIPYIDAQRRKYLSLAKETGINKANTEPLLAVHDKYRRVPSAGRKYAEQAYMKSEGIPPDMTDPAVVNALIEISKVFRGAVSQ